MERIIRVFDSMETAERADLEEWLLLTGEEPLAIAETLRREMLGAGHSRLQRVLRVLDRTSGQILADWRQGQCDVLSNPLAAKTSGPVAVDGVGKAVLTLLYVNCSS